MRSCYVFSNGEALYYLAKNKDVEGLEKELENSVICKTEGYSQMFMKAVYLFEFIYNELVNEKEFELLKKISRKIEKMCVTSWDVETLLSIKAKKPLCGELTSAAEKVILAYEDYRAIACWLFNQLNPEPKWTREVEDILVIFDKGRLSFVKDNVEYIIYYAEDKYFTLVHGVDNKEQMVIKSKTYQ